MNTEEKIAVMQAFVDGQKIEILTDSTPFWHIFDGEPQWNWGENGYRIAKIPDSIDWSHVAPEFKWMARDESGDVFIYDICPSIDCGDNYWSPAIHGDVAYASLFASYRRGTVDWQESLVERPE